MSGFANMVGPVLGANANGTGKITGKCFGVIIMDKELNPFEVNLISTWNDPNAAEVAVRDALLAKESRVTVTKHVRPKLFKLARVAVMKV